MKKAFVALAVIFAMAFVIGSTAPTASAASCYYTCSCSGTPLYCCVANGVTTCKFTSKFQCPQIYNC
ncbi:MAG: hypothetical protein AB1644_09105 [Candidatus Zixiibacteriota bacterium]